MRYDITSLNYLRVYAFVPPVPIWTNFATRFLYRLAIVGYSSCPSPCYAHSLYRFSENVVCDVLFFTAFRYPDEVPTTGLSYDCFSTWSANLSLRVFVISGLSHHLLIAHMVSPCTMLYFPHTSPVKHLQCVAYLSCRFPCLTHRPEVLSLTRHTCY